MNPNSQNQTWSKWVFVITGCSKFPRHMEVKANCAKFFRTTFGSSSQARFTRNDSGWTFEIRTEGHPAHDPQYRASMEPMVLWYMRTGFGVSTQMTMTVIWEAGSKQDGKPPDQMIILPTIEVTNV